MARTVTARFDDEQEAERALAHVSAEVPLRDSAVITEGVAGALMLDSLHLNPEERAACEQQLSKGGFLLLAQVATEGRGEMVLRLLDEFRADPKPRGAAEPVPQPSAIPAPADDAGVEQPPPPGAGELRIGSPQTVRVPSRVDVRAEEPSDPVELLHEETRFETRPINRRLSDAEVSEAGLFTQRVIEISEMREEPAITKEAYVREELIVRKVVRRRPTGSAAEHPTAVE